MSGDLYEGDEGTWTEVFTYSAKGALYQEEFSSDGRWRHRERSKPGDLWPQPWKPGKAPEVDVGNQ